MGHLVDMGCATDDNTGSLADLHEYLLLRRFAAGPQMQTLAAVLGIFGALDVPIVYMSNRWWRTQHPAPVFGGSEGSGMAPSMVDRAAVEHAGMVCVGSDDFGFATMSSESNRSKLKPKRKLP